MAVHELRKSYPEDLKFYIEVLRQKLKQKVYNVGETQDSSLRLLLFAFKDPSVLEQSNNRFSLYRDYTLLKRTK